MLARSEEWTGMDMKCLFLCQTLCAGNLCESTHLILTLSLKGRCHYCLIF